MTEKGMQWGHKMLKTILIAANIMLSIVSVLASVSMLLSPNTWIIPAYLGLAFPLLLIGHVLFIIFWGLLFRKWILISIVTLLLLWVPVRNTAGFPFGHKPQKLDTDISVLSYNTMACGQLVKRNNPVLGYIDETNADIVCLQEFAVSTSSKYLTINKVLDRLDQYPYKHISYSRSTSTRHSGVATFSKYPIVGQGDIPFKSHNHFNSAHYTDICVNGDTLRIFNCHLESNQLTEHDFLFDDVSNKVRKNGIDSYAGYMAGKLSKASRMRSKQAQAIAQAIDQSPHKVLVCGDFNDVPVSYTYHSIAHNLNDAFVENHCGLGTTFKNKLLHVRIDYILHSTDLSASQFTIGDTRVSDHQPILCKIGWKE